MKLIVKLIASLRKVKGEPCIKIIPKSGYYLHNSQDFTITSKHTIILTDTPDKSETNTIKFRFLALVPLLCLRGQSTIRIEEQQKNQASYSLDVNSEQIKTLSEIYRNDGWEIETKK